MHRHTGKKRIRLNEKQTNIFKVNRYGTLSITGLVTDTENPRVKNACAVCLAFAVLVPLTVDLSLHKVERRRVPDGVCS